ncbi:hypothetical protein [Dyadobacter sp. CY323]|uniref:hypothetical protein n=1 Tax=Dyadobacter sp. CY323 TaxID=2907302 RepID=UPI001F4809EB|nr:hypothetical protein [Dyadobacter sp. CY323]MCE6987765.1 hypothetical protein [Dyadobacter sp. CY323]
MKSVNYSGFIPHLIESAKTLKLENEELKKSVKQLEKLKASINELIENNKAMLGKTENNSQVTSHLAVQPPSTVSIEPTI